ncbi:MAG: hypothetical protein Q4C75_08035 [Bergeyella zoohelcum]|nr:hypothetical protein [Bergeyella zoohelcum]
MTIQERILQVLENKQITPYRFCKDLNLSMGYLDKRGAIGTDKYLKIIEYFSEINPEWLLTGKGSMLKTEAVSFSQPQQNDNEIITLLKDKVRLLEKNNTLLEKENAYLSKEIQRLELEVADLRQQIELYKASTNGDIIKSNVG